MLRITPMGSSAKSYLRDGLSKADYYTNGEPILETWKGELAAELGLVDTRATIETFDNLCDNINPNDGLMLSAKNVENRKAYYDFTFSAPKSVSILHGLTNNFELKNGLENVMRQSVIEAMEFAQKEFSLTRDKTNNQNRYLKTGKLIYTEFLHDTSRPIGGIPDPHLHIHAAVFNLTKDPETGALKAMEFHDFAKYRNQIEAVHHSILANKLQTELGLIVRPTNNSFEIAGIERNLIDQYSNATKRIEKFAEDKGITSSSIKGNLGAKLREKKQGKIPQNELAGIWLTRLDSDSQKTIQSFKLSDSILPTIELNSNVNNSAIQNSIKHNFERSTVVDKRNLITFALNSDLTKLNYEALLEGYIKAKDSFEIVDTPRGRQAFLTTKTVLEEEKQIKDFVNSSLNQNSPINPTFKLTSSMSTDQDRVFYAVLNSRDSIQYIRGDAGSGKTYLIQNLKNAMEDSNHSVFAYAPTAIAGRKVLREEVSKDSNTIQTLINNPNEQAKLNSKSIVFIDEAGMVSYADMIQLMKLRQSKGFSMILVGDTKQHASVARGDALRYIETNTNINTFALTDNRRQSDPEYKKAINQLARKDVQSAIQTLDNIGAIKEIPLSTKRYEAISKEYITKVKSYRNWQEAQKEVLIVTPTNLEASIITNKVRRELKKNGYLEPNDTTVKTLEDRGLTTSQKQNPSIYNKGDVVLFNQNVVGGYTRASQYSVDIDKKTFRPYLKDIDPITNLPIKKEIPFSSSDKFTVLRVEEIKLAVGELIRLTNHAKVGEKTILKGSIHSIKAINQDPNNPNQPQITLDNNQTLPNQFAHLKHGYTSTSYSSQGRTVTNLIIAQSSVSLPASSFEQGYVSASRGKASISIYTDNKQELVKAISKSKVREFGVDLGK